MVWGRLLSAVMVAAIGLGLLLGPQTLSVADEVGQRRAAKIELDQLVEKWSVSLGDKQWQLVVAECASVQTTILRSAQQESGQLWGDYKQAIGRTGGLIWFLTDSLIRENNDASYLNLAMVSLKQQHDRLRRVWDRYDQSLGLTLAINCAAWPNQFVAGLRQVGQDQVALKTEIESLAEIIGVRIPLAVEATQCRLLTEGAADCPSPEFDDVATVSVVAQRGGDG